MLFRSQQFSKLLLRDVQLRGVQEDVIIKETCKENIEALKENLAAFRRGEHYDRVEKNTGIRAEKQRPAEGLRLPYSEEHKEQQGPDKRKDARTRDTRHGHVRVRLPGVRALRLHRAGVEKALLHEMREMRLQDGCAQDAQGVQEGAEDKEGKKMNI